MRVIAFRAVIGEEQDEGILILTRIFQVLNQAADVFIQRIHHCCIDLHPAHFQLLLLPVKFVPARPFRVLRSGCLTFLHQAGGQHAFDAFAAYYIIAVIIDALVLVDIFPGRLQRPMRRGVGGVTKERFAVCTVFVDVLNHFIGEIDGRIKITRQRL